MSEIEKVADFVAERAKKDPKVRQTIRDAHLFDSLKEHEGWQRLRQHAEGDRERFFAKLAGRLMRGESVPQGEIDFHRGFYQGVEWILGHPEQAEASLERAARQAWRKAQQELAQRQAEADGSVYTR
jgi:phosphoserine phosphatase